LNRNKKPYYFTYTENDIISRNLKSRHFSILESLQEKGKFKIFDLFKNLIGFTDYPSEVLNVGKSTVNQVINNIRNQVKGYKIVKI
jgi:hypothetical protein